MCCAPVKAPGAKSHGSRSNFCQYRGSPCVCVALELLLIIHAQNAVDRADRARATYPHASFGTENFRENLRGKPLGNSHLTLNTSNIKLLT